MLVMFGSNAVLILAIVDSDLEKIQAGKTLEYVNPPHDPQLVANILVMHGKDKADVVRQINEAGCVVDELTIEKYLAGERTDGGFRSH